MLPKKNRLSKKTIEKIFEEGKFISFPNLALKFLAVRGKEKQTSFIVPKNIAKLAVRRNSLRRKSYVILEKHFNEFPAGFLGVFIFKKYQDDILILENEIKNILNKIN